MTSRTDHEPMDSHPGTKCTHPEGTRGADHAPVRPLTAADLGKPRGLAQGQPPSGYSGPGAAGGP